MITSCDMGIRIYLKARYGSDDTVTEEDVTLARRCLAEIRQGSAGPRA